MVGADQPGARILEVGCGTGTGSVIVASSFLQRKTEKSPGSVLICTDFSLEMMTRTKERFDDSDFIYGKGNKVSFDETNYTAQSPPPQIDIEEKIKEQGDYSKLVLGYRVSGTELPFKDESFDGYASNLVLMLIENPKKQIQEAFRVLKKGAKACFTVWGRRENTL